MSRRLRDQRGARSCWDLGDVEDLDDERFLCVIVGCDLTAVNSVRFDHPTRGTVILGLCRRHTDRRHHVLVGPGPE